MMHHIFCYQASPAKKQFSKDSDQSSNHRLSIYIFYDLLINQYFSSDSSSPVAPKTPSTVEIQHNGKTYTIQVQVLGTEETWQTPSLVLASVKGNNGKAVFSQVMIKPSHHKLLNHKNNDSNLIFDLSNTEKRNHN